MSRTYRLRHFKIGPPCKWVDSRAQYQSDQSMSIIYGLIAHGILGVPCLIIGQSGVAPDESDCSYWPINTWPITTRPVITSHRICLEQQFVEPIYYQNIKGHKTTTREQIEDLIKNYLPKSPITVQGIIFNPWLKVNHNNNSHFWKKKKSRKRRRDDYVQTQQAFIKGAFETLGPYPNYRKPNGFWWP